MAKGNGVSLAKTHSTGPRPFAVPRDFRFPVVAIVDVAGSDHGRLMQHSAHFQAFAPVIRWITPDLQLPVTLASLDEVAAVAIPIAVKGATLRDRFTQRLM